MYRYLSVEEVTFSGDEKYVTYGILVKGATVENYISDVFTDRDTAERFVKLCTESRLAPIHLFDVLEDMF